ncbi:MAG: 50S ribosomal protein L3 glutamine methyltransferase [Legionellaceae bacterium]
MKLKYQSIIEDLTTIGDYIRWVTTQFSAAELVYGHGTDNAWDEAIYLISLILHLPPDMNPLLFSTKLTRPEREQIIILANKRIEERMPIPYLTNKAWFSGLPLYIDKRVIIPRSPMAELIENHFSPWANALDIENILDLCTGSGCIAIACAHAFPEAFIDAVDISDEALAVAKINVKKYDHNQQINLIKSDLFAQLSDKKYDIIISNPPYVDKEDMQALPIEYQHEPALALEAGNDGLSIVNQILKQAIHYLTPQGLLFVEVGNSEAALMDIYPDIPFTWLEFQKGGNGVFLISAEELAFYQHLFD